MKGRDVRADLFVFVFVFVARCSPDPASSRWTSHGWNGCRRSRWSWGEGSRSYDQGEFRNPVREEEEEEERNETRELIGFWLSFGCSVQLWIWMEARALAGGAVVDWESFVRYDWLSPNL